MKSAIAAMEIFGAGPGGDRKRFTIAVGRPLRSPDGGWTCTVTIADVLPPTIVEGVESFAALAGAVGRVRSGLAALEADGWRLFLDRECERSIDLDVWLMARADDGSVSGSLVSSGGDA